MQINELSSDLIKNIYEALKECCSYDLTLIEEYNIVDKDWVLSNRKYRRIIKCICRYHSNEEIISLSLGTDDWSMQYIFLIDTLNKVMQDNSQIEVENELRWIISSTINQVDNCFFENKGNDKMIKKSILDDIKSFYKYPLKTKFEYDNNCCMEIDTTLFNLILSLCYYSNCIQFLTLEGSSPFTPFLNEDTIRSHETLINRGYKKLIDDITRNYKKANEMQVDEIYYKNDVYVLKWFNSHITEDGLNNIFNEIEKYMVITAQRNNVKNIIQSIRKDLKKIFYAIENIFYIEDLADKDIEENFLKNNRYGQSRKDIYQGIDVEFIFVKYRSIIDYIVELIKEVFPETETAKLEGKFAYFSDVMKDSTDFDKYILSSNWFQSIKHIRDNVIHHGATCLVYNGDNLGFQMYDLELNNLVYDIDEYMKINENVFRLDRYLVINIAYLFYFLDICFKAVGKKIYKQSNTKEQIKKSLEEQKEIDVMLNQRYYINVDEFGCTCSNLLKEWCGLSTVI